MFCASRSVCLPFLPIASDGGKAETTILRVTESEKIAPFLPFSCLILVRVSSGRVAVATIQSASQLFNLRVLQPRPICLVEDLAYELRRRDDAGQRPEPEDPASECPVVADVECHRQRAVLGLLRPL